MPTKRARTISATTDVLKTTCAMRIVSQPERRVDPTRARLDEEDQRRDPEHDLGRDERHVRRARRSGPAATPACAAARARASCRARTRRRRCRARSSRPFRSGSVIVGSRSASPNHFVEKPSQIEHLAAAVERETTTTQDRRVEERRRRATAQPPRSRLPIRLLPPDAPSRRSASATVSAPIDDHRDRGAERPVARLEELLRDQVAGVDASCRRRGSPGSGTRPSAG